MVRFGLGPLFQAPFFLPLYIRSPLLGQLERGGVCRAPTSIRSSSSGLPQAIELSAVRFSVRCIIGCLAVSARLVESSFRVSGLALQTWLLSVIVKMLIIGCLAIGLPTLPLQDQPVCSHRRHQPRVVKTSRFRKIIPPVHHHRVCTKDEISKERMEVCYPPMKTDRLLIGW
jgi:hypothetical protein